MDWVPKEEEENWRTSLCVGHAVYRNTILTEAFIAKLLVCIKIKHTGIDLM